MPDYGQKATDAEFRRLRAKISDIYEQAHKEIVQKGREFAQAHAKREAKLRQDVADGKMTQADFDAWMRGQVFQGEQWTKKKQQMADTLYHADQVAQDMVNDSRFSVFAENANYMEYSLEHDAGIDMGFGLYDADTVRRLVVEEPDLLPPKKRVGRDKSYQWYNRQIQTAITQGIIQGESIDKIARRIGKQTGETSMTAMLRNAHTMHTGAQNAGRMEGLHQAQKLGINVRKQWMATLDHHTRDAHADLDGQVQDVDAPFKSSLGDIMYPGDPTADPGNVWNCRCTLTYVYPDYQPTGEGVIIAKDGTKLLVQTQGQTRMQRRDNETGENIEYMTYREWEAMKRNEDSEPINLPEPAREAITQHVTAQGRDISQSWQRRPDRFDFEINDVINAQGFDGVPRIVDADEFDRAVQESGFIAQRSYSAPNQETLDAYRDQLYRGEWYVDCGTGGAQYGQGMYCAADYTGTLTDGIKNEMEHYRDLGESRYGDAQREYAEKVYQEEMDKVDFPLDDRYKNAFTDEMGITDMWTRGSEERQFIKDWISKNPAEANKLKEAYEKAQEIGAQKGMEIESLTREQFKEKYPNVGARSYTETLTLAPDAKVVTWREINDIRLGNLDMEYRTREIERIISERGFTKDEATFVKYNLGTGVSWNEVDAAARRLTPERRNSLIDAYYQIGEEATNRYNEEHDRRIERAHIYQEKYHDIGSLAAALGYDAINAENHGQSGSYTVILNRTKVIFRRP